MNTNLPQSDDGQYLKFVQEVEKISKLQVSKIRKLGPVQEKMLVGDSKQTKEAIVIQYMRCFQDLGEQHLEDVYEGCHKMAFNTDFESACDVNLLFCMRESKRFLEMGVPGHNSDEILTALSIFYVKEEFQVREEDVGFLLELKQHLKPDCQKLIDYFADPYLEIQQAEAQRTDQAQKYIYQTIYESEIVKEEDIKGLIVDVGDQVVNFEKAKAIPEEIEKISEIVTKAAKEILSQEETEDLLVWYQAQKGQDEEQRSHVVFDMSEYLEFQSNAIMVKGARSVEVNRRRENDHWGQDNLTQYSQNYVQENYFQQIIVNDFPPSESLINLDLDNIYFEQFFDQDEIYQERFNISQRNISWRDGVGTFYTYDSWHGQSFVNSGSPSDTYSQLIFCFCNNIPDYLLDDDLKQLSFKRSRNVRYDHLVKAMKALNHITEKQILIYLCVKEIFFKNIKLKVANASIVSFLYLTCKYQEVKEAIQLIEHTALMEKLVRRVNKDLDDILKEMLFFKVLKFNNMIMKQDYLHNRIGRVGNYYLMTEKNDKKLRSFQVQRFRKI